MTYNYRHRPLAWALNRAREELRLNPTITVYHFTDGHEYRCAASPVPHLKASFDRLATSVAKAAEGFAAMADAFKGMGGQP